MIAFYKAHPVFSRRSFFKGMARATGARDIVWLRPDGVEMTNEEWNQSFARCLGVYLSGEALDEVDARGRPVRDNNFLLLLNAHFEEIAFTLPDFDSGAQWQLVLDTTQWRPAAGRGTYGPGSSYPLQDRSLALFVALRRAAGGG